MTSTASGAARPLKSDEPSSVTIPAEQLEALRLLAQQARSMPLCPGCGARPQETTSGLCLPCHDQAELAKQRKREWWAANGQRWREERYGNRHGKPKETMNHDA